LVLGSAGVKGDRTKFEGQNGRSLAPKRPEFFTGISWGLAVKVRVAVGRRLDQRIWVTAP
jgi:hypothetical protein